LLRKSPAGISLCEHLEADGEVVFRHACKMGLEGIVSKRRDSRYSSGATPNWVKSKNPKDTLDGRREP
jgi:bifunctional non-homologous end joining protein LigD